MCHFILRELWYKKRKYKMYTEAFILDWLLHKKF